MGQDGSIGKRRANANPTDSSVALASRCSQVPWTAAKAVKSSATERT
jgi:hypothetical protein